MTGKSLQEGLAYGLWSGYEYALPDAPGAMAKFLIRFLTENGYIQGESNE
jgi:hypothetical protein